MSIPIPDWIAPEPVNPATVSKLQSALNISAFLAEMLVRRGYSEPVEAAGFLQPRLNSLSDPFLLPDMQAAVTRIFAAIDQGERITLYGDYDVDGVTSLSIMHEVLSAYGGEVQSFLPHRIAEGYGVSAAGLARCLVDTAPQLLIAVDCGTSSKAELDPLMASGVDVIVLDHHECKEALPACSAVVNPKRGDTFGWLCSAGLAFKLCHALQKERRREDIDLRSLLDLVALGTVADLVPLESENRIFVKHGLLRLAQSRRPGIRALSEVAGLPTRLQADHIGFGLGPRLNAAGRLDTAMDAYELLTTRDPTRARALATHLNAQNRERQSVERATFEAAQSMAAAAWDSTSTRAIVVASPEWHPGVIGIVASRIMRAFHRPAIVIAIDESGLGKGSGRSIDGLNLVEALGRCSHLLDKFGGHEMAAGLSIRAENVEAFARELNTVANDLLSAENLIPSLRIDAELRLDEIHLDLLAEHDELEPFGMANARPLFMVRGAVPAIEPVILKEKHLKLHLDNGRGRIAAIFFNGAEHPLPRPPWDIAFHVERNEFRGNQSAEMRIRAIRPSM